MNVPAAGEPATGSDRSSDIETEVGPGPSDVSGGPGSTNVSGRARIVLQALLQLDPEVAAAVRGRTPPRLRPRPQSGPSADYGRPDGSVGG